MNLLILNELFGFVALVFTVIGFLSKKRQDMILFQSIGYFIFAIHFYLMGAYSGSVMNTVSVIRNIIFKRKNKNRWARHKEWLYFFILLILFLCYFFWQGPISFFPAFGLVMGTIGIWQSEEKKIRIYMLVAVLSWTLYSVIIMSYFAIINQIILLVSLTYSIYKFDIKSK